MKKTIFMLLAIVVTGLSVSAQGGGGGGMRRTPEERTKMVMDKFADWKLDKAKSDQIDSVFVNSYRAQQKMMQDMRASGGTPDRDKMTADMKKMNDDRDDKLKALFTADQFKKWKDEIEPTMRRGGGGGGNGGGGNGGGGGNN